MAKIYIRIILLLFLAPKIFSQRQEILFHRYTMNLEMGFSSNGSNCLLQDKQGFIWIGTYTGLNRFDGYRAKVYRYEPGETGTISGNIIDCIFEDRNGMIWVGTRTSGLNKYSPYSEMFTTYIHDRDDPSTISSDRINVIYEDRQNNLWIGTDNGLNLFNRSREKFSLLSQGYITTIFEDSTDRIWVGINQGLYLFDYDKKSFIPFEDYFSLPNRLAQFSVHVGVIDHDGTFWVGTDRGLIKFNPHYQRFIQYNLGMDKNSTDLSNFVQTILFDETKTGKFLWVGTLKGLYKFDIDKETFQSFEHNPLNDYSISHNSIQSILKDRSGCLWIGVENGGLNKVSFNRDYIRHYFPNPLYRKSPENDIQDFCQSKSGTVWIATPGGLWAFDKKSEKFTLYQHNPKNPKSLSHNDVRCVFEDIHGDIWIGTADGLNKFDRNNGFISHKHDPHNENNLSNNSIHRISGTSNGNLVIGTWFGLNIFNPHSQKCMRYLSDPDNPNSISDNAIMSVMTDSEGIIWIGTQKAGLNRFDPNSGQFIHYKNDPENPLSISSNSILTIFEYPINHQNTLWIGTDGGGLCQFNKKTGTFIRYTKKDGLRDNIVNCITADFGGNLWVATQQGISILNLDTMAFKNFEMGIIIPRAIHACFTDQTGEIFWGGWFGMARFFPDSITLNSYLPSIVLTDFKVNNQPVHLDTVISYNNALKLTYKENFLSFEFAALDFNRPLSNLYSYKMEGIDQEWIITDVSRRYAAYTDLDPGEYVFHVKGSNNDGIWNEEGTSLKIIITPPWWKTNLAYGFYLLLVVLVIYGAWRFQLNRISMRHDLEIKQLRAEKLEEVDRMKSRFFANISHEFRTPLTLILGPISKMIERVKDHETKQELNMMQRNARSLLRMINQLLDLSKIEAGRMTLHARPENIVTLLNHIVQSFESQAKLKNIQLVFQAEQENIPAYIDREKLETIVNNLLSNAFKFTPEGGSVVVEISLTPLSIPPLDKGGKLGGVGINISNTGTGIPPDRLPHIFDRFYQVDDSYTREHEGTGIGLALTRELIELHCGKISIQSELNKGTTFTVILPLGKDHLNPEEMVEQPVEKSLEYLKGEQYKEPEPSQSIPESSRQKALSIVLIVEDNSDMRVYMHDCLASDYRIIKAVDGKDGLHRAIDKIPDLIISDVMMPKMDGFELCGRLKSDERTSHIPIILLTARASAESKIKGLELGADDYLIKPFDRTELRARVKNLIEGRHKLRTKFSQNIFIQPRDITVSSYDQKFLQRTMNIIEQYVSDAEFNVESFCKQIGMSRVQLHRKLRALTNLSTTQFMRTIRLRRAAQLIEQKYGNIAEIAYEVGFNKPSHFAECFRKQFGQLPSEYAKKQMKSHRN